MSVSFSSKVKQELGERIPAARHCQLAELSAILLFDMKYSIEEGQDRLLIKAENEGTLRKCFTILQKAFNIREEIKENDVSVFNA